MIRLTGIDAVLGKLTTQATAIEAATHEATHAATEILVRAAEHHLRLRSHPPHTPTPSAPGDPPARITGNLANSLHVEGPTSVGGVVAAKVGPTAIYGRIQELGGTAGRGAHLPARPYMAPALRDSRTAIALVYRMAWAAALR